MSLRKPQRLNVTTALLNANYRSNTIEKTCSSYTHACTYMCIYAYHIVANCSVTMVLREKLNSKDT